jgi:uncharacterized repeat protein (TIGR02543 family)
VPTAPTKSGYTFEGWYKEATLTNAWDFETDTVTEDITLYAKWEMISETTEGLSYTLNSGNAFYSVTGYTGTAAAIRIPAEYNGLPVTAIASSAFSNKAITSVVIPSSVESIGASAFSGCNKLESITFGENSVLTSIGASAFYNCTSLTNITIPSSVESIGSSAFYYCYNLIIYAEAGSVPDGWASDWNYSNCPVYYYSATSASGKWRYVNGVPTQW